MSPESDRAVAKINSDLERHSLILAYHSLQANALKPVAIRSGNKNVYTMVENIEFTG